MGKQKRRGHGEGSIYRRQSDGRYVGSFIVEATGKRKYLYGETQKEVLEKLRKAQREQEQGMLATGPQQKLKDYLEHWLEDVDKPAIRESTYIKHHHLLKKHILPALGQIQVQKLTAQQVQAFYAEKLKAGLSPGSVISMHGVLHKALKNAVRWKLVAQNVCDVVSPPRRVRHEAVPLSQEQAHRLLEAAKGHHLEALLTMALVTGMRQGELFALRWQDIDVEGASVHVRRTVLPIPGRGYVEHEPKTAKSRRKIRLPQFVMEALKKQRLHIEAMHLKAGNTWRESDLVFPSYCGGFIDKGNFHAVFQKLLKVAGLPHKRFHDLRHSTATILLTMGVHPKIVQEILGHSTISMTMDTYSHLLPSMQDDATHKWDDLFKG